MRLAYILSAFPCRSETFAAREIAELQAQGFAITVFAAGSEDMSAVHRVPVEVVYRPPPLSLQALFGILYILARYPFGVFRWLYLIGALLRECPREAKTAACNLHAIGAFARRLDRAGLQHVHAYFLSWPACIGLALAAVTGVSLSIGAHARDVFVERGAVRLKAARARFIVACTRQAAEHLKSQLPAACHAKLFVCYHGVDIGGTPPGARSARNARVTGEHILACVGRLVAKKGHQDLLRAFARVAGRLPCCKLIIAGSGPERERIEQLTRTLGLAGQVELWGWQDPDVTRNLIETADLLVVPSVVAPDGDRDGIPNVILEALAVGTPVVATRLDGIAEALADGRNGLLVPPGDIDAMASALVEALGNPRRWERLSGAARATAAQRFDIHSNVRQLAELFVSRCPVA